MCNTGPRRYLKARLRDVEVPWALLTGQRTNRTDRAERDRLARPSDDDEDDAPVFAPAFASRRRRAQLARQPSRSARASQESEGLDTA
eukprot:1192119-Prorocentrum_minimum.AAC.3